MNRRLAGNLRLTSPRWHEALLAERKRQVRESVTRFLTLAELRRKVRQDIGDEEAASRSRQRRDNELTDGR